MAAEAEAKADDQTKKQEEIKKKTKDLVGGFYVDPNHYLKDGTFAGTRTISDHDDDSLKVIGTDDGVKWWILNGKWINKSEGKLTVDFTGKGAPESYKDFPGTYKNGIITWKDDNKWTKITNYNKP